MQDFDLENFLPYKLSIASQAISGLIAREYEFRFGLSMIQWRVLVIVSNHAPLSASEICTLTLMEKMTVSRAIKSLKTRKLITSTTSQNDARKSDITLTKTGHRIYKEIIPIAKKYEKQLLNLLTDSQKFALNNSIDTLVQGVGEINRGDI